MENTIIKQGDTIRIKENLMEELIRLGFKKDEMEGFVKVWKGKTATALDVYTDNDNGTNEIFVTVELCCEIPLTACELVS